MHVDRYSEEITKKLSKLKKKNPQHYDRVDRKIKEILDNPKHKYKNLRYDMGNFKRIHIGHFVLIFRVDHLKKLILFEDYDHHDNIYLK